ncbi:MAG: hypothetical protein Q9192_007184 [Flavoplaca navasiana]
MEDVGYVNQNPHGSGTAKSNKRIYLTGARSDGYPIASHEQQWVIGLRSTEPISDLNNRAIWKRDIRMSLYRNLESLNPSSSGIENESLGHFLATVSKSPSMLSEQASAEFLTREIGLRLCNFMLRSADNLGLKQPLSVLGVDSLVAAEIRNWWRQGLGLEICILEIMNAESIEQLGKVALEGLKLRYQAPKDESGDTYLLMKAP